MRLFRAAPLAALLLAILFGPAARADEAADPAARTQPLFDEGKLLATGGVTEIEGAGGGGLVPWALITGYGTRDGISVNAHDTFVDLRSFSLNSAGAAIGLYDRLELSYTHQWFDTRTTGAALGIGRDFTFEEDVIGAKLRLFGNTVYDQASWLPQVAAGVQYKSNENGALLHAVGAKAVDGADFYLAATKLFLAESILVDATIRLTRGNEFGILGFGGPREDGYQAEFEGSVAYLVSKRFALGAEFRTKPDNLGFTGESNGYDVFAAYFLDKHASLTLAYVDLGEIATRRGQDGVYASLQLGF